jgi:hypothetical protein
MGTVDLMKRENREKKKKKKKTSQNPPKFLPVLKYPSQTSKLSIYTLELSIAFNLDSSI